MNASKGQPVSDPRSLCRPGERLTRQRRSVLRLFSRQEGHLTVESILAALRDEFPKLNTGTIYRELAWLKGHGLISETDVGEGAKVYERVSDPPHHHLVCLQCGSVDNLADRYLDSLRISLGQELGFLARIEHFAVFGTCVNCREQDTSGL